MSYTATPGVGRQFSLVHVRVAISRPNHQIKVTCPTASRAASHFDEGSPKRATRRLLCPATRHSGSTRGTPASGRAARIVKAPRPQGRCGRSDESCSGRWVSPNSTTCFQRQMPQTSKSAQRRTAAESSAPENFTINDTGSPSSSRMAVNSGIRRPPTTPATLASHFGLIQYAAAMAHGNNTRDSQSRRASRCR